MAYKRSFIVLLLTGTLLLLLQYVPFEWPSYGFWAAAICAAAALVSVIRPNRVLWLTSRWCAVGALSAAVAVAVFCMSWPGTRETRRGTQLLHEVMPAYDFREEHRIQISATPAQVWSAVKGMRLDDLPVAQGLMMIRMAAAGQFTPRVQAASKPLLDIMAEPAGGFTVLAEHSQREIVLGMVGRPWAEAVDRVKSSDEFRAYSVQGSVRIGFNFHLEPQGTDTVLTTETRIAGTDAEGTRTFGRYWRVVYPGSAIMRQVMLETIAATAAR